ncbi:YbjN domain-containing protein [candidate division KSB1 bacterium]
MVKKNLIITLLERRAKNYIEIVENYFENIGINPKKRRIERFDSIMWWFKKGTAIIFISLREYEGSITLYIYSPILYLPEKKKLSFYKKCLELNMTLINCALAILEDKVILISKRPVLGLGSEEFEGTFKYLSETADIVDNKLADEFDLKLYLEKPDES